MGEESGIMDPDEYRLMHPFTGMKSTTSNLAKTLNGWEKGNDFVYKLEADKLKSIADEALKNQTLTINHGNQTTIVTISVVNNTKNNT
jgi:phosphomevalonate kinase